MGKDRTNTHADDSIPINGVWASKSLEIGGFKILPFDESGGNHSTMIFDVSTRSLIGEHKPKVVRAACPRLNCKTLSLGQYNNILERSMAVHQMEERLDAIITDIVDDKPTAEQKTKWKRWTGK